MRAVHAIAVCLLATSTSCTDPLRDREIEALGDEAPGVSPGPEHRPGQPCVLCHSDGGPASSKPFAVDTLVPIHTFPSRLSIRL